jgi:hypothetical protein
MSWIRFFLPPPPSPPRLFIPTSARHPGHRTCSHNNGWPHSPPPRRSGAGLQVVGTGRVRAGQIQGDALSLSSAYTSCSGDAEVGTSAAIEEEENDVECLKEDNIIGKGSTGIVYHGVTHASRRRTTSSCPTSLSKRCCTAETSGGRPRADSATSTTTAHPGSSTATSSPTTSCSTPPSRRTSPTVASPSSSASEAAAPRWSGCQPSRATTATSRQVIYYHKLQFPY